MILKSIFNIICILYIFLQIKKHFHNLNRLKKRVKSRLQQKISLVDRQRL